MAWRRDENRSSPRWFGRSSGDSDKSRNGQPNLAQRRLDGIRVSALLERERELRMNALDAYEHLDEASERLIAAIVRVVEARSSWAERYESAAELAESHSDAAGRARIEDLPPPAQAPWPSFEEHPTVWSLLQPDAVTETPDPDKVKAELKSWAMSWYNGQEDAYASDSFERGDNSAARQETTVAPAQITIRSESTEPPNKMEPSGELETIEPAPDGPITVPDENSPETDDSGTDAIIDTSPVEVLIPRRENRGAEPLVPPAIEDDWGFDAEADLFDRHDDALEGEAQPFARRQDAPVVDSELFAQPENDPAVETGPLDEPKDGPAVEPERFVWPEDAPVAESEPSALGVDAPEVETEPFDLSLEIKPRLVHQHGTAEVAGPESTEQDEDIRSGEPEESTDSSHEADTPSSDTPSSIDEPGPQLPPRPMMPDPSRPRIVLPMERAPRNEDEQTDDDYPPAAEKSGRKGYDMPASPTRTRSLNVAGIGSFSWELGDDDMSAKPRERAAPAPKAAPAQEQHSETSAQSGEPEGADRPKEPRREILPFVKRRSPISNPQWSQRPVQNEVDPVFVVDDEAFEAS